MLDSQYHTPPAAQAALNLCFNVIKDSRPPLGELGDRIYRAEYCARRPSLTVWFAFGEGIGCTMLSGDVGEVLGTTLTWDAATDFALVAFNGLTTRTRPVNVSTTTAVDYLLAVLALTEPFASRKLISEAEEIWNGKPAEARTKNRTLSAEVQDKIRPPKLEKLGSGLLHGNLCTWSDPGGLVTRFEFLIWPDGRLMLRRDILATRTGPYSQDALIRQ